MATSRRHLYASRLAHITLLAISASFCNIFANSGSSPAAPSPAAA